MLLLLLLLQMMMMQQPVTECVRIPKFWIRDSSRILTKNSGLHPQQQWLLSLCLMGAAWVQWKIGR